MQPAHKQVEKPHPERRPIALPRGKKAVEHSLRDTGIDILGRVPWGSHFCLFYETTQDLTESALHFFKPAPLAKEKCLWKLPEQMNKDEALDALRFMPALERWRKHGGLELRNEGVSDRGQSEWKKIVGRMHEDLFEAVEKGFDGVRALIQLPWRDLKLWPNINAYEQELDDIIAEQPIILLCAYPMKTSRPEDVLDVAHTHQCTLSRRMGNWEFLCNQDDDDVKKELEALNADLDQLPAGLDKDANLNDRERVVLAQIVKGASSKVAARAMGVSPRTVEYHRAKVMRKFGAKNTAELVRMVTSGGG